MAAVKGLTDPRDRKIDYDLQRVDFEWVKKTEDRKELSKALAALKEDTGFPHLQEAVEKRLCELDPAFKRKMESQNVSAATMNEISQDISDFLDDIKKMDQKLSREKANDEDQGGEIFNKDNKSQNTRLNEQIEEIEKKKQAENERLKGNECMKAKEFQEAIACYGKALDLCPTDAATFSNRAMAHLKTKEYARALEDAEAAIKLKEDYVKAYHRRGKAYLALNKVEMAIRDFQYILEKEPHNKEAMQEIKNARVKLDQKLDTKAPSTTQQPAAKNKFTRVAIQEESEEDEAPQKEDAEKDTFKVTKGGENEEEAPKKLLIEEVKSTPTPAPAKKEEKKGDWWKKSDDSLNYDDFKTIPKKDEPENQEKIKPEQPKQQAAPKKDNEPQKFKRVQIEEDSSEEEQPVRLAELEEQFKKADLSKLEEAEAKVVKESADLDKKISKIEEQTKESLEKKAAAEKKMKEMQNEIERKTKEAADIQAKLNKQKDEQEKASIDLQQKKADLEKALAETKLKASQVEKSAASVIASTSNVPETTKKVVESKPVEPENKAQEKVKLDALFAQVDKLVAEAEKEQKKGLYDEATAIYLKAVESISQKKGEFSALKKNLTEKEALIYMNVASCYKQTQATKKEIEYASKVIERAPYVQDSTVLAKAYLLRGYAYESIEKFKDAKEDMTRVRELQPSNQEATKVLTRLNKAIADLNKVDLSDVDAKLGKIKDAGNQIYTTKKYKEAIEKFSEGINLYLADPQTFKTDKDVKLKVTQLYTNRSLAHHQLADEASARADADHVLTNLDPANVKALNRRAVANKSLGNVEEAIRDFQALLKTNPGNVAEIKKDLDELMAKLVQMQKAKKEAEAAKAPKATSNSKILEMPETPAPKNPEQSAKEPMEEENKKPASQQPKKTKNLDAETINKAVEITSEKISKKLLTQIPKTAAGFESDFNSLKKDLATFYSYVHNIPTETVSQLFKNQEISAELFAAILKVVNEHGLSESDGIIHAGKLIAALGKCNNFDMTLMFMDSKEKKDLVNIIQTLKKNTDKVDKELLKQIDTIYKL